MSEQPKKSGRKSDERDYFDRLAVDMEFVVSNPPDHVRSLLRGRTDSDESRNIILDHDITMLSDTAFVAKYRVRKEVVQSLPTTLKNRPATTRERTSKNRLV